MLALAPAALAPAPDARPTKASFTVAPLEVRRSSRGVDHIASPHSCRSNRSWPDGTTVTSDSMYEVADQDSQPSDDEDHEEEDDQREERACTSHSSTSTSSTTSTTTKMDLDEVGASEEEVEEADVDLVGTHFEAMNAASEALNSCQQAQSRLQSARSGEISRWAQRCAAAFLPKLTAESLQRARACFNLELSARKAEAELQQLEARRSQVDEGSAASRQLAFEISERKEFYSELEENLEEALRAAAHSSWSPALRYLEEEYEHQQILLELDAELEASARQTTIAKARYEAALSGLKNLSAAVHRSRSRRPTGGVPDAVAKEEDQPN